MRKIKFRGKNKDGVWLYGGYVEYLGKPRIVNEVNDGPLYALVPPKRQASSPACSTATARRFTRAMS